MPGLHKPVVEADTSQHDVVVPRHNGQQRVKSERQAEYRLLPFDGQRHNVVRPRIVFADGAAFQQALFIAF